MLFESEVSHTVETVHTWTLQISDDPMSVMPLLDMVTEVNLYLGCPGAEPEFRFIDPDQLQVTIRIPAVDD